MKMKRLLTNLSLVAFGQVMFLALGGTFVAELISIEQNNILMYFTGMLSFTVGGLVLDLYVRIFAVVDKKVKQS